jgi:type II secretory ATPase GspE/PulE/Tfp pilus assembly ATPase PilB-like protein
VPGIKIITIENPIEYHLPGIVQTQTDEKKNYTFNEGLRSALRQDPDVIMVGEIRDHETAETSINAALTGHLVFSTLHTNNAAGTFPRLVDLGLNPKTLSSAINIAIAQRLVRTLCNECKKEVPITDEDKKIIIDTLESVVDKTQTEGLQTNTYFQAVGCEHCNNIGYKGRIGIHEAILMNDEIEKVINENLSEREIKKASLPQGILDLKQDGVVKVLKGITTLDELSRVVDMES